MPSRDTGAVTLQRRSATTLTGISTQRKASRASSGVNPSRRRAGAPRTSRYTPRLCRSPPVRPRYPIWTSPSSNFVTQVPQRPWRQPLGIPTPCISATSSRVLPGAHRTPCPNAANSTVPCNGGAASSARRQWFAYIRKLSRLMHSERTARDVSIPWTLSMNAGGPQRKKVDVRGLRHGQQSIRG